jgi:16S rRNA (cytosine1407-C5)-methyltransferase
MTETPPNPLTDSLSRFVGTLTVEEIQQILDLQSQPLPTGIRINPLKSDDPKATIQALSERYGWQTKPIPFYENAWTIHSAQSSPGTTIEHRMGAYYLQDAASMVPVSLFDLDDPHPLILDMAASPGGKTTHLIDRTLDRGFILANDGSKNRVAALKAVLANWGGVNIAITNYPGESFGDWYPETFDLVLLDAPCSMENLRPTPNHPLRETTRDERLRLQDRQIQLLSSGLRCLKVGGQLAYATCSLAPEEDEAVLDALLHTFPESFEIVDVARKLPFNVPGLTQYDRLTFDPSLVNALHLWPYITGMSGFFCALLRKTAPMPGQPTPPPARDFERTNLHQLFASEVGQITEGLSENYGLNLREVMDVENLELFSRHDQIFLIPSRYLDDFQTLPFEYIGMPVGKQIGEDLEPSPEFVSRFGHHFTTGIIQIGETEVPQWIVGRDIRHPDTLLKQNGRYLLVTDPAGRNLGLGKLLPKRLRNMLPRQSIG